MLGANLRAFAQAGLSGMKTFDTSLTPHKNACSSFLCACIVWMLQFNPPSPHHVLKKRRAVLVRLPKMDAGGRASFIDTASKGRKTQDKQTRTSATGCSFQMPIDACVATSRIQLRACAHCGDEFEWFSCLDGSVESCVD